MSIKKTNVIVGLTGNICSGKTTVLNLFAGLGCAAISADDLAHRLLEKNENVRGRVLKYFGTIDRKKLAEIVFTNPKKLHLLETILHPEINKEIEEELRKVPKGKIVVIEIPLLYETGWDKSVDHTVFVSCPAGVRKERFLAGRKASTGDFECRETAQINEALKAGRASFVIDNTKDLTHTKEQVKKIIATLKEK